MDLCTACQNIDYLALVAADLQECRHRQEVAKNGDLYQPERSQKNYKHHDDIYHIQKSAKNCILCKEIFNAFLKREVVNQEEARGLPIVFRASGTGTEVCYVTCDGLIRLCGFNRYMNRRHVDALFKYYEIKEDHSPPILKILEEDSVPEARLGIALAWLKNCVSSHTKCKPALQLQHLPKRLINVGHESQDPFLEETDPTFTDRKWLSLSYCWGDRRSMTLTKQTMGELRNGTIPLKDFDPAIRDAILVTRALDITYIWVDALCIIQDDNGSDWREQAPKMNQIYGGSTLTLVITNSDSVMNGFLKGRPQGYIHTPLSRGPRDNPSAKLFLSPEWDKVEDETTGHWSTRGWTMQEGLLPNRLLHFKNSQMVWECCEETAFERGVTERLRDRLDEMVTYSDDISFGSGWIWSLDMFMIFKRMPDYLPDNISQWLSSAESFWLWYKLIENYAPRKFSKKRISDRLVVSGISDRLVAISGLAQVFSEMIPCQEYVAGLWKADLIRGLLWYTKGSQLIRRQYEEITEAGHLFPSWSWTSIGYDHVKYSHGYNNHYELLSRIEDVDIELVDKSQPFGEVKSGKVTISGPLKEFPRLYYQNWKSEPNSITKLEHHLSKLIEDESTGKVESRYSSLSGRHFAALQMIGDFHKIELLILESTGTTSNGFNEYCRVGVVTLHDFSSIEQTSPAVLSTLAEIETSLASRLGPRKTTTQGVQACNAVVEELMNEEWKTTTVVLI